MNKDQEELLLDILNSLNSTQDHQVEIRIKRLRDSFHVVRTSVINLTQDERLNQAAESHGGASITTPAMINAPPTHDPNEQLQAATTVQTLHQKLARRSNVTF